MKFAANYRAVQARILEMLANGAPAYGADMIANGARRLPSLAALKAAAVPTTSKATHSFTEGRLSPGDRGGGAWRWEPGDQSANITADPFSIEWAAPDSAPTGTNGAYRRMFGPILPQFSGALPGVLDRLALQGAIDYGRATGRHIEFEGGEFLTDLPLYPCANLVSRDGSAARNTSASGADTDNATFNLGNYHAGRLPSLSFKNCAASAAGTMTLTLSNPADAAAFSVGAAVYVRSTADYLDGAHRRPIFGEFSEIAGIAGAVLTLSAPLDEAIAAPKIAVTDTSADEYGRQLFVARDVRIDGLRIISDNGSAFQRGGNLRCRLRIPEIKAKNGIFGNGWTDADIEVGTLNCSRKAMDIAQTSARVNLRVGTVNYTGGAAEAGLFAINENSRNIGVNLGTINAGAFDGSLMSFNYSHRARIHAESIVAPFATASGIGWSVPLRNGVGDTQDTIEDCVFSCGTAYMPNVSRAARWNALGGASNMVRCGIRSGRFIGAFPSNAAWSQGVGSFIDNAVTFENGSLKIDSTDGAFTCEAGGGIDGTPAAGNHIAVRSKASKLLTAASASLTTATTIQTTSDTTVLAITAPADSLAAGNRIKLRAHGSTGVAAVTGKTLKLSDAVGALATFTTTAAANWSLDLEIVVQSATRYEVSGVFSVQGQTPQVVSFPRTGIVLTGPLTFTLAANVSMGTDSVTVQSAEFWPEKRFHARAA